LLSWQVEKSDCLGFPRWTSKIIKRKKCQNTSYLNGHLGSDGQKIYSCPCPTSKLPAHENLLDLSLSTALPRNFNMAAQPASASNHQTTRGNFD
jgi:hypothetical protein